MRAAWRGAQDQFPALGGLDGIARTIDGEMGDGPQRRQLFDRLMGRAILAKADRIVRHDEDRANLHERRQADGWAAIVGEA